MVMISERIEPEIESNILQLEKMNHLLNLTKCLITIGIDNLDESEGLLLNQLKNLPIMQQVLNKKIRFGAIQNW